MIEFRIGKLEWDAKWKIGEVERDASVDSKAGRGWIPERKEVKLERDP
jgi:hypothetical protein